MKDDLAIQDPSPPQRLKRNFGEGNPLEKVTAVHNVVGPSPASALDLHSGYILAPMEERDPRLLSSFEC